ncbi:MAG TPA: PilZ domain-containing protein [Gammaproteobacteria bacterium]|nr:PilZ domain-containing protein [Gammaproteobacteria bacterium]
MHLARNVLMKSEQRTQARRNLSSDQIPGKFSVLLKNEEIEFTQVNDVSISGMGICLDHYLGKESHLQVSYQSDDLSILINAEVIWQEKLEDNSFRIGVQFSNEDVDSNVMLFMAMREYIDDFGEAF